MTSIYTAAIKCNCFVVFAFVVVLLHCCHTNNAGRSVVSMCVFMYVLLLAVLSVGKKSTKVIYNSDLVAGMLLHK